MFIENTIRTVTGLHSLDQTEHCQVHEHLIVLDNPAVRKHPALLIDSLTRSADELTVFYQAGGRIVGDAQPLGAGRAIDQLESLSLLTKVKIVASTGFHMPMFYPENHFIRTADEDSLRDLFLQELQTGCFLDGNQSWPVKQTSIRAGMVKAAIGDENVQGPVKARLCAAAGAAAQAGVPLMLHTEQGLHAMEAIELITSRGLHPNRIMLCHADRQATTFSAHLDIAGTGVWLEYDTIGRFRYHDDESEIRLIQTMIEHGYCDRLLLSMDTTRERLKAYGATIGLDYILNTFLPALQRAGIAKAACDQMTRINPAEALSLRPV